MESQSYQNSLSELLAEFQTILTDSLPIPLLSYPVQSFQVSPPQMIHDAENQYQENFQGNLGYSVQEEQILARRSHLRNMGSKYVPLTIKEIIDRSSKSFWISDGAYFISYGENKPVKIYTGIPLKFSSEALEKFIYKQKQKIQQLAKNKTRNKKKLAQLLEDRPEDGEEILMAKNLIRHEVIYTLSDKSWIQVHVGSRSLNKKGEYTHEETTLRKNLYCYYLIQLCSELRKKGKFRSRVRI